MSFLETIPGGFVLNYTVIIVFLQKKLAKFACETEQYSPFLTALSQMSVRQIYNYVSRACDTVL